MSTDGTAPPTVERATLPDLEQTIALWKRAGLTRPWNDPATDFERSLQTSASEMFIIRDRAQIVASVMVGDEGHRGWVYYLAVDESRRGRGWAQMLMQQCEAWLLARNCPKLMLMVRSTNTAVIGFYESMGYDRSDVVTMEKWLVPKIGAE